MRISDWSSDVCSSDLGVAGASLRHERQQHGEGNEHGEREDEDASAAAPASGGRRQQGPQALHGGASSRVRAAAGTRTSSERRRVGKERVRTVRPRGTPTQYTKKNRTNNTPPYS